LALPTVYQSDILSLDGHPGLHRDDAKARRSERRTTSLGPALAMDGVSVKQ
jgi:hypothetical protein